MKSKKILVTGGAGFIGSFLVDSLINQGYEVTILDNLENQVHQGKKPSYLNTNAQFINGDVKNYELFKKTLLKNEIIFHLAARVGVGQSNYEIKDYIDANVGGMANLLDIVVNNKTSIEKILMTASMTSYGEGNYQCLTCGIVKPNLRGEVQMREHDWELHCPNCNKIVTPMPTNEDASITNNSIYSLSKNVQEELLLYIGKTYSIPAVSLRCFNVYGPRQSLSNPYTGVSAIFMSRLKNNKQPVVYEDGKQTRDFISVHDVVNALIGAMESKKANYEKINVGSGNPVTISYIAETLAQLLGKDIKPHLSQEFRKNDIRHCYADISKAKKILNWKPIVSLEQGLLELLEWSKNEESVDLFQKAEEELRQKNLL